MTTTPSQAPNQAPAPATGRRGGSPGSAANYSRMVRAYQVAPTPGTVPPDWRQQPDGSWWRWMDNRWQDQPEGPPPPPAAVTGRRFTTEGALNKAGLLGLLALAVGVISAIAHVPLGVAVVAMLVALGVGFWCSFSPRRAPVLGPVYAVLEGSVLGVISRYYSDQGDHVVTLAIIGTVAVVAGVWTLYRTGLVRVGNRFVQVASVAGIGLLVVSGVAFLTGWGLSGASGLLIFGVLYFIFGVMSLFVDFSFVTMAERMSLPAEAEWYSAFSILVASCLVYLSLLRLLGGRR